MKHKISNVTYIVGMPRLVELAAVSRETAMSHGNVTFHGMSRVMEMPCPISWKLLFPWEIWAFNTQNIACCHMCPRMEK